MNVKSCEKEIEFLPDARKGSFNTLESGGLDSTR